MIRATTAPPTDPPYDDGPPGLLVDGRRYWSPREIAAWTGYNQTSISTILRRNSAALPPAAVDPELLPRSDSKVYDAERVRAFFSPERRAERQGRRGFGHPGDEDQADDPPALPGRQAYVNATVRIAPEVRDRLDRIGPDRSALVRQALESWLSERDRECVVEHAGPVVGGVCRNCGSSN